MTGDVIKSFLVGLGFDVDESSLAKFNKSITTAAIKVTALATGITAAAGLIGKGIAGISESFEDIGYQFHIIAPAINKALVLRNEMIKAYQATGINMAQVIQNSVKLNMSIAKTKFILDAIYKSVGSRFFTLMTKQSDQFRAAIYKNLPKIQAGLEKFINFIFKALEAVTELGTRLWSILTRVYDFFTMLSEKTNGWSTVILAVIAAWKLLNLSFLATPLGMLIAGFVALLALWDDFKVWKEGGKSLINWGSDMTKTLVGLGVSVGAVAAAFGLYSFGVKAVETATKAVELATKGWAAAQWLINVAMEANPIGLIIAAIVGLISLLTALDAKWQIFGGHLSGFFSGLGGKILSFVGGGTPNMSAPPVGGNVQNSNSNATLHQQTNINVTGAADAGGMSKSIAGQQSRVNRDLVDNMVGAAR